MKNCNNSDLDNHTFRFGLFNIQNSELKIRIQSCRPQISEFRVFTRRNSGFLYYDLQHSEMKCSALRALFFGTQNSYMYIVALWFLGFSVAVIKVFLRSTQLRFAVCIVLPRFKFLCQASLQSFAAAAFGAEAWQSRTIWCDSTKHMQCLQLCAVQGITVAILDLKRIRSQCLVAPWKEAL